MILSLGQVCSRATEMAKYCHDCQMWKPETEFALRKRGKPWCRPYCKPCGVKRTTVWQEANRERKNANGLRWARANSKARAEYNRDYRLGKGRKKSKDYQRAYRAARPWLRKKWRDRWKAKHPELVAELKRRRESKRRARKRGVGVSATSQQVAARIAYYGGRCWVCQAPGTELDHVKPLSVGGAHIPANLRPICPTCNRRKGNKWPWEAVA